MQVKLVLFVYFGYKFDNFAEFCSIVGNGCREGINNWAPNLRTEACKDKNYLAERSTFVHFGF